MLRNRTPRKGLMQLEVLFSIALVALMFQLFPSHVKYFDARRWTRTAWIGVTVTALIALILLKVRDRRPMLRRSSNEIIWSLLTLASLQFVFVFGRIKVAMDVREWSRSSWLVATMAMAVVLLSIRFESQIREMIKDFRVAGKRKRIRQVGSMSPTEESDRDKVRQRDSEWRQRAKKRLPFY